MISRQVAGAARRLADRQTEALAAVPSARLVVLTVTQVTAGAAADGNALVEVTWRGTPLTVSGYPDTYTPAEGDRVRCSLSDGQLFIDFRIIGRPPEDLP